MLFTSVGKRASLLQIIKLISTGLGFLSSIVLARYLGITDYGVYASIIAFSNIAVIIFSYGIPSYITREVARDPYVAVSIRRKAFSFMVLMGLLLLPVIIIYCIFIENYPLLTVTIILIITLINGVNAVTSGVLKGLKIIAKSEIIYTVVRQLVFVIALLAVIIFDYDFDFQEALIYQLSGVFIALILGNRLLKRNTYKKKLIDCTFQPRKLNIFFLLSLVGVMETQGFILIASIIEGPESAAAISIALLFYQLLLFGMSSVNSIVYPQIAWMFSMSDLGSLELEVKKTKRFAVVSTTLMAILVIFFAQLIPIIYGASYVDTVLLIYILCAVVLINSIMGPSALLMVASGHEITTLSVQSISMLVSIIFCVQSISQFGAITVPLSIALYTVLWKIALACTVWNKFRINLLKCL